MIPPAREKDCFFSKIAQIGYRNHPASCSMATVVSFLEIMQPGREADHLPAYSAQIKNKWS